MAGSIAMLLSSCDRPTAPEPTVLEIVVDSSGGPISRSLTVRVEPAAVVQVAYGADGAPTLAIASSTPAVEHHFPLPRLRSERTYRAEVSIAGRTAPAASTTFGTGALPAPLASIEITETGTPTYPVSIVEVVSSPVFSGLLLVEDGEIVGYRETSGGLFGSALRANGEIALIDSELGLLVIRADASIAHRLPQAPSGEPGITAYGRIHHDLTPTPGGALLFIANETRTIGGLAVVGEALWEWHPETGAIAKRWSAFDFLDWDTDRGDRSEAGNWLHGNGLRYGPRGNILLSLRNINQVLSIAPNFSSVEWRLGGANGNLEVEPADRFFGQHFVSEPALDRVLIYDNGFQRPGGNFTRAVEYQIDRTARTAARVWEFRHSPDIYAPLVGSALRLPNQHTAVLFGMIGGQTGSSGPLTAVEISTAGTVVWRLGFGPQITRVYRVTPVSSVAGEQYGILSE